MFQLIFRIFAFSHGGIYMDINAKAGRYERIYYQLKGLFKEDFTPVARMATITALLHHKMKGFFWTGFYLLDNDKLIVGPYQGPLACIRLEDKNTGVCWMAINSGKPVVVPDVHKFPGHIACDSRSNSEVVVPLRSRMGDITGVIDVDSREYDMFDDDDARGLEKIISLVYE